MFSFTQEEKDTIARASVPRPEQTVHGCDSAEDTIVIIKPDAMKRDLAHEVIRRVAHVGWVVRVAKCAPGRDQWLHHYAALRAKYGDDVLQQVCDRMDGVVIVMRVRGYDVVKRAKSLVGATDPRKAAPGTIRGDLGVDVQHNIVHASEVGEAADELALWSEWV